MKGKQLMAQTDSNTSKNKFKHLLFHQRTLIEFMLNKGYKPAAIARELGVNRSTITRELERSMVQQIVMGKTVLRYFAETAQQIADKKKSNVGRKPKFLQCSEFISHADKLMKENKFSPDVVVGQAKDLELFTPDKMVCTNTLYRYIDAGVLKTRNIDLAQKLSRAPQKPRHRTNKRILGKSIEERPEEINNRSTFGHWEIDCVLLKKTKEKVLLTMIERVTRHSIIRIIESKTAACVSQAIRSLQLEYGPSFKDVFKSITSDNGSEFADLTSSLENVGTEIYYAHPYSSWERGANEQNNGIIRRFVPKGIDPAVVTHDMIRRVEAWINHYPRKVLGYATSFDVFCQYIYDFAA